MNWETNQFCHMVRRMTHSQLFSLFSLDMIKQISVYDHAGRCVREATFCDLPWYVAWYLSWNHKRGRQLSKPPSLAVVSQSVDELGHRLMWKWHHRDGDSDKPALRCKGKRVMPFHGLPPPEIANWTLRLKKELVAHCCSAQRRAMSHRRPVWARQQPIVRRAIAWLQLCSPYLPVQADKGGRMVLVTRRALEAVHDEIIHSSGWYELAEEFVAFGAECLWNSSVVPSYRNLCSQVCSLAESGVRRRDVVTSIDRGQRGLVSKLINTCKDHKSAGSVKFRPIHSAACHPFEGLSRWVNLQFSGVLSNFKHLVFSTESFLHVVNRSVFPEDTEILHFDLDDFFMAGQEAHLTRHASLMANRSHRSVVRSVLAFLLNNHFVSSSFRPGQVYRVKSGSGQGMIHSGSVANAAFLHACELSGPGLARRKFATDWGVVLYLRYIDNLIFFVKRGRAQPLLEYLSSGILSPYAGKLEEMSEVGVSWLDLYVFKGSDFGLTGRFSYRPVLKSKGRLLNHESQHHVRVHLNWPTAYLRKLWGLSSSLALFQEVKHEFLQRMKANFYAPSFVSLVDSKTNFILRSATLCEKSCQFERYVCLLATFHLPPFVGVWLQKHPAHN